jgi:hypothetical protein
MGNDEDYYRSLAKRIGPILAKYSTSSSFPLDDLDVKDGKYEVEIKARYGTEEDYSVYIQETVRKGARGKGDDPLNVVDQNVTIYLPEDFWGKEGKEMAEDLRTKFLITKGSTVKIVVVSPVSGFKLETVAK